MTDVSGSGLGIPGVDGLVEIGRSAAAITYRGRDAASGRSVIVKVLQREATAPVQRRFEYDQGRIAELIEHPNIVAVFRHGYTAGNLPYIVAEDVSGGSMADKVGAGLDGPGVIALGIRVAGALESAHRSEVVHGDLRPEDVLVNDANEPLVGDFGVVTVTGMGPDRSDDPLRLAHAAPEQLEAHVPTRESDIYALGSVLYALLAGQPAFVRQTDVSVTPVIKRIATDPAPDLRPHNVPDQIADVIAKAMAKNPADRYGSAEEFGRAMQQAQIQLGLPITEMTILGAPLPVAKTTQKDEAPTEEMSTAGGAGGTGAPPDGPPLPPKPRSKVPLIVGGVLGVVLLGGLAAILLGGGGDDDDNGDGPPRTRPTTTEPELAVTAISDDLGIIALAVPEEWNDVDGTSLSDLFGVPGATPDVLAATDVAGFIDGLHASGIEVTALDTQAVNAANNVDITNANVLLDVQAGIQRGPGTIVDLCAVDGPRTGFTAGEFNGLIQRFDDCDGTDDDVVIFVGSDAAATKTIVAEIHLVVPEDEEAFEAVLQSIVVSSVP